MCFPPYVVCRTCHPSEWLSLLFVGNRCGGISRERGPGWSEPLTETKSLPPSELEDRQRESALRGGYFRSTGISNPRNPNAASPLTQPCNGVATIGSFARADGLALLFLRRLHVEAEEFERRIAIDPAVPRMRLEQNDVIWLIGDIAVLFAILVVQGHLASAADDVKNVCLFRWSLVKRDQAVGVDVPAHDIDAFADINAVRWHLIECPIVETLVRYAANVRYRRELSRLLLDRNRFAVRIDFNARQIAGKRRSSNCECHHRTQSID